MAFDEIVVRKKTEELLEGARVSGEVLSLRRQGYTYPEIANLLGISVNMVAKRLNQALAAYVVDGVEQLRLEENDRLEAAHKAIWHRVMDGELAAVDRFLKIQERRAKLLGLDTPTKVDLHVPQHTGPRIIEVAIAGDSGAAQGDSLALPSPSVEQSEEDHLVGGGDGERQDVVGSQADPSGSSEGA